MPSTTFVVNPAARRRGKGDGSNLVRRLADAAERAHAVIGRWPGYDRTPLLPLDAIATEAGVASVLYKDESGRFGLGSFKALGGAYAVYEVLRETVIESLPSGETFSDEGLLEGHYRKLTSVVTVASATAGNHGRSVAWGAQLFGCRAVIYIHAGVGADRAAAIERFGADVRRIDGDYDASVRMAASMAAREGWLIVSDTSYEGYTDIPLSVMQGYTVMFREIDSVLSKCPTHVFLQGGVGGLAASAAAWFADRYGTERPTIVVVEPEKAACLTLSAAAGELRVATGDLDTMMLGMACGVPSLLAIEILREAADAFLTVSEKAAADAMRALNRLCVNGRPIVAGECAGAGLAGLRRVAFEPEMRHAVGLDRSSRVLLIGTEGATDPRTYRELTGRDAP